MDNKRIDNEIINTNKILNEIDGKIDIEKNRIRQIGDMQDNVREINRGFDRVIDILSRSIKGPNTDMMFDDMRDTSRLFYIEASSSLDEEALEIRNNVNKLYQQKDDIIKDDKKNRGADNADSGDKKGEFM